MKLAANKRLSLAVCLGIAAFGIAQTPRSVPPSGDPEALIGTGMKAYKTGGAEEAVKTWITASAIEGSKDALSQANLLHQVQDYYGTFQSYSVVKTHKLGDNVQTLYVIISFEKGPLFGRFDTYRTSAGWVLTAFTFNTKWDAVFPSDL